MCNTAASDGRITVAIIYNQPKPMHGPLMFRIAYAWIRMPDSLTEGPLATKHDHVMACMRRTMLSSTCTSGPRSTSRGVNGLAAVPQKTLEQKCEMAPWRDKRLQPIRMTADTLRPGMRHCRTLFKLCRGYA